MKDLASYITLHKKTHIIFDFDETIFRLILPWEDCLTFSEEALAKLDAELLATYGSNWSELQNEFVKKHGQKAKDIFLKSNTKFETELLAGVEINPELLDFIRHTKGLHFAIWSSNTKPIIQKVLQEYHVEKVFEKVITRHEVDFLKPNPHGFSLIYDTTVAKEKYLMVGDSVADEGAAKEAGIDFFHITYW